MCSRIIARPSLQHRQQGDQQQRQQRRQQVIDQLGPEGGAVALDIELFGVVGVIVEGDGAALGDVPRLAGHGVGQAAGIPRRRGELERQRDAVPRVDGAGHGGLYLDAPRHEGAPRAGGPQAHGQHQDGPRREDEDIDQCSASPSVCSVGILYHICAGQGAAKSAQNFGEKFYPSLLTTAAFCAIIANVPGGRQGGRQTE